jgi:4'-phosphopantetheinyl transferase EntD
VIEDILPAGVSWAEEFGDPEGAILLPAEEPAVARAVDKRVREYTTVRHCARRALADLGFGPLPILNGPNREPLWPEGVIGALTHCDGYRAAVVARAGALRSLGIDAEPNAPLPDGVLATVADDAEQAHVASLARRHPEVHWDRLLFSAKESVYKTWFPLARVWLGFEEATLEFDPAGGFSAKILKPGPLTSVVGRWTVSRGLVVTSIAW